MKTHRSKRVTADSLAETVNASVSRALEVREAAAKLSPEEIAQVSGARIAPEWIGIFTLAHKDIDRISGLRGAILRR